MTSCLGPAITWLRRLCVLHIHMIQFHAKPIVKFERCGLRLHLITASCRVGRKAAWCSAAWLSQARSLPSPGLCEWSRC